MKKKRKKACKKAGGYLDKHVEGQSIQSYHLLDFLGPKSCVISQMNCIHSYIMEIDILHECSFFCLIMLGHSCCETELHVGKTHFYCMAFCNTCNGKIIFILVFLQVSPKIPHRQGFRAH